MKQSKNIKEVLLILSNAFLFCFILFLFALMLLGCSKVEYRDKIVEVYMPVPQKCDYNLSKEPSMDTSSNENLLNSLTELSYDSVKIRNELKSIPCLNIKWKDIKMKAFNKKALIIGVIVAVLIFGIGFATLVNYLNA